MIYDVIADMGHGKTLFASCYAKWYSQNFPDNTIYSNYKLNLPNTEYTPLMVLPFSKLKKCLIICDDFYALRNVTGFIAVIVNLSRKLDIDIILTAQYYTMIPKQIRMLSEKISVNIDSNECLHIEIHNKDDPFENRLFKIDNVFDYIENIYNTNEVVLFPTMDNIIDQIINFSENTQDLNLNLELMFKSRSKLKKAKKEIEKRNIKKFKS